MALAKGKDGNVMVGLDLQEMETQDQIDMVARIANGISLADIDALLQEYQSLHTTAPIFDPTAYSRVMNNLQDREKLVKAFRGLRAAITEITAK